MRFPGSFLAASDEASSRWRGEFLSTYLERDLALLGPRLPAEQMRRFWTMLARPGEHPQHGAPRGRARDRGEHGAALPRRAHRSLLVRQLPAWSGNSKKRLVKAPKVYVRASGLTHRLAGVPDLETLLGHPLCGHSWEGFVIEQILAHLSDDWSSTYYRTSAQAEIDLVLEGPRRRVLAIEIKRASPAGKGFLLGCEEVGATERLVVIPEGERHPLGQKTEALPGEMPARFRRST